MRRLIFTLLYDRGSFMLSRNFRLQKVGTIDWLFENYDFATVSRGLDELMVLDVSKGEKNPKDFAEKVSHIAGKCFIPMTVGGGITSTEIAKIYMRSGADKLLLNSCFAINPRLCCSLAELYGRQCIVAGIDYQKTHAELRVVKVQNGTREISQSLSKWVEFVQENGAGEILFQSIERDGTGMGLDLSVIDSLDRLPEIPCILMGGVGKAGHIVEGLSYPYVDAVATANLFNFIGSSFLQVREFILKSDVKVAQWADSDFASLRGKFAGQKS